MMTVDDGGVVTARFLVRGLVQGVGFRWWTVREARSLGLRGWVRNLDDGRVEVVATGAASLLDRLGRALGHGPPQARVLEVGREETVGADVMGGPGPEGFEIRH